MDILIQKVASQAQNTFSKSLTDVSFPKSLTQLVDLINELRPSDLSVSPRKILNEVGSTIGKFSPDIIGIDIETNQVFSMNMFLIRDRCKITLHDHSNMHGILKTIFGTVKLTSYTISTEHVNKAVTPEDAREIRQPYCLIPVDLCMSGNLTREDAPVVFTPTEGNFHEICSDGGAALVFDMLSPCYDVAKSSRKFYRVFKSESSNNKKIWLHKDVPDFSIARIAYRGPKIFL